ncbi:MAG: M10 family metallopeptidase C-terminal domain-containing protein, partial [Pseudomonadota bacterium]
NSGTIFGATDGLYFGDAQHDALVVNKGHILSNSRAVNIDGAGVVLANHGRIAGTDDQRNGTVYADNTADEYTILNHKGGVIDAGYGNNGSAISLQTGDSKGDVVFADVVNHGLVRGRGDAEEGNGIGDGVRLFSGVEDAVFQGSVVNHGRILASKESDAAVGIRVEDGVRLDGGIVNHGRIFGSETAIDASDAAPDIAVKNAGVIIGDVVLTDGNDLFDGAHGRVNGVVSGGAGADALIGGRRGDTLAGGAGDDDLTGNGGADIFVFAKEDAPSKDIVNDFEDGRDRIDVSDFGFKSVAEIGVEQLGDNLRLTFDADNSVLLKDTSADQITSDDFIF